MSEYRVLIPLDGSRLAEHSLAFLRTLSHFGALKVTLLSVIDIPEDVLRFLQTDEQERQRNLLTTYLKDTAEFLERHLGAGVKTEIGRGAAATVILEKLHEEAPDLLVISTHGRSGFSRIYRGAVADKVIRGACCNVLVVGPKVLEHGHLSEASIVPPFKQILVPLDGSEAAEQAIPVAAEIAQLFNAPVHLIRVMSPVPLSSGFWGAPATLRNEILDAGMQYLKKKAEELEKLVPDDGEGISHAEAVFIGSPISQIEEYIRAHDIDLVVMTSHGRTGVMRSALGSVTDRLIGFGPPVLVLRTRPVMSDGSEDRQEVDSSVRSANE